MADTTPPNPMTGLSATAGDGAVTLAWNATLDPDRAAVLVYRDGSPLATLAAGATTYLDAGLTNGTTYAYAVSARDAAGNESAPTVTVTATPATPAAAGAIIVQADLVNRFRLPNLAAWSSDHGNPTDPVDVPAVQLGIDQGEADLAGVFSGSDYAVPFQPDAPGGPMPAKLKEWATVLAGFRIATSRGFGDQKTLGDLARLRDEALAEAALYAGGLRSLPGLATRAGAASRAVLVIDPTLATLSAGATLLPPGASRTSGQRLIPGYGVVTQG